jgi:ABC-type antimicrobial peptide transport system permease subunit
VLLLAAILAVCLSVVALYGITAFYVAQSTREIGIRLAIGAPRPELVASFVVRGLRAAAIGGLIGFGLAFLGTGLLGRWLVGVRPLDPEAFLSSGLIVGAAVTLACYGPARRAARIDPVAALRGF